MDSKTIPHIRLAICTLLMVAVFVIYARTWNFKFVNYDDPTYVTENPYVQKGLTADSLSWAFTTLHGSNWHPLTWLSHMLDWQLFGNRPGLHHLVNGLIHCLNAILLFLIIGRMAGSVQRGAFVAALFAVHPLQVESVAWVAQRKGLLCALFLILTLWAYGRYAERPSVRRYLPVLLFFVLGLMAKPVLVTLPLVLLLLDYWPLRRFAGNYGRLLFEKMPLFALAAVSAFIAYLAQLKGGAVVTLQTLPFSLRLSNALISYVTYIQRIFWPFDLAVFYPYSPEIIRPWNTIGALLILGVLTTFAISLRRQYPYVAVGWLWYLVTLIPVIGLIQVGEQAMADRYAYIPLIGIFIALTWLVGDLNWRKTAGSLERWLRIPELRKVIPGWPKISVLLAAAAVVFILAGIARVQAEYWRDSITLFRHALAVTANNAVAHNNLGLALAHEGRTAEAMEQFQKALEISPDDPEANYNLGLALASKRKYGRAVAHYRIALKSRPNSPEVLNSLGNALATMGYIDEAIGCYRKALELNPGNFRAHNNLANQLFKQGKVEESISEYVQAIKLKPDFADARKNLAVALFHKGDYAGAWREVHLARKYGASVNPGFLNALSWKMPEPKDD